MGSRRAGLGNDVALGDPLFAAVRARDEQVIAIAADQQVRAVSAIEHVVPVAAVDPVVAVAAKKAVVPVEPVDLIVAAYAVERVGSGGAVQNLGRVEHQRSKRQRRMVGLRILQRLACGRVSKSACVA